MDEKVFIQKILLQLSDDLKEIKAQVQSLQKTQAEQFKESWIDGQDVSVALNISQRSVQTLRTSGLLPFTKFHGKCFYKVADLEALFESNYIRTLKSKRHD